LGSFKGLGFWFGSFEPVCFGEKHTHSFGTLGLRSILKIDEEQVLWSKLGRVNHGGLAALGRLARTVAR
jgi:hypothetical protein